MRTTTHRSVAKKENGEQVSKKKDLGTALAPGDLVRRRTGDNYETGVVVEVVTDDSVRVQWPGAEKMGRGDSVSAHRRSFWDSDHPAYRRPRTEIEYAVTLTTDGAQCNQCNVKAVVRGLLWGVAIGCASTAITRTLLWPLFTG